MSDVSCRSGDGEKSPSAADFDMIFDIVSNRNRRIMLHQLEEDNPIGIDELAEEMEPYVEVEPPRLITALYQQHLPRIDDTRILDYDSRSKTVRYYGHPFLEELLDCTKSEDLPNK